MSTYPQGTAHAQGQELIKSWTSMSVYPTLVQLEQSKLEWNSHGSPVLLT